MKRHIDIQARGVILAFLKFALINNAFLTDLVIGSLGEWQYGVAVDGNYKLTKLSFNVNEIPWVLVYAAY